MEETEEEMGEMGEGMAVAGEEMAVEMAEETEEEMAEVIGNFENSTFPGSIVWHIWSQRLYNYKL